MPYHYNEDTGSYDYVADASEDTSAVDAEVGDYFSGGSDAAGDARAGSGFAGTGSGLSGTGADAAGEGVGGGGAGAGPTAPASISDVLRTLPATLKNELLSRYTKDGAINWTQLGKDAAFTYAATRSQTPKQAGYNVPIPKLDMVRQQINYNDPNRRPGSAGLQYFTDPRYAAQGDAAARTAADTASAQQAQGIRAAHTPSAAPTVNPWAGKTPMAWATPAAAVTPAAKAAVEHLAIPTATLPGEQKMAAGGLASFAHGGANYLQGPTDGMADKLNTSIDNHQAAKLSHGEFVIPADVVSHLGNGNSDAGAQKLYDMMARIRKARTGNPKQGKRINPDKFMPGGLAQYANGGAVAFVAGGDTAGAVTAPAPVAPASTSTTDVLSEWAGPMVSDALSKGYAASNAPYQAYTGATTAGASDLQQQAFAGASDMAKTGYTPGTFTSGTFDAGAANKYMNPYLQASLDPQLKELQRQSQINNMTNAGKLTQAGAFGGSRQAILTGEENRNLLDKSQDLLSTGYNNAYDKAMAQFNSEQNRDLDVQRESEKSRQFSANNALDVNKNLLTTGATQRDIEQQGLTADKLAFEEERDNPMKMAQYQVGLLSKMPITTQNTNQNRSDYDLLLGQVNDLQKAYDRLNKPAP